MFHRPCVTAFAIRSWKRLTWRPMLDQSKVFQGGNAEDAPPFGEFCFSSFKSYLQFSHEQIPVGRGHPYGLGPVAGPIPAVTAGPSLLPTSLFRAILGLPCGRLSGGYRNGHGLTRLPCVVRYVHLGPTHTPVMLRPRGGIGNSRHLITYLLVRACQHLWLVARHDACGDSHVLTLCTILDPRRDDACSNGFSSRISLKRVCIVSGTSYPALRPRMSRWDSSGGTLGSVIGSSVKFDD